MVADETSLEAMGMVPQEEQDVPSIPVTISINQSFIDNKQDHIAEATEKLVLGLTEASVRSSLISDGLTEEQTKTVMASALRAAKQAIKAAKTRTKEELLAAAEILLAKAVQGDKIDTAHKILRTIVELSEKKLNVTNIIFDPDNPQNYLTALLDAQGRGAEVSPAILAATARAINAFAATKPTEKPAEKEIEEPEIKTIADASKYAMHLINGGKPGI